MSHDFSFSVVPPDGAREATLYQMMGAMNALAHVDPNPSAIALLGQHISQLADVDGYITVDWCSSEAFAEFSAIVNNAWRVVRANSSTPFIRHVVPHAKAPIVVNVTTFDRWRGKKMGEPNPRAGESNC